MNLNRYLSQIHVLKNTDFNHFNDPLKIIIYHVYFQELRIKKRIQKCGFK